MHDRAGRAIRYVDVKELERVARICTYDRAGKLLGVYLIEDQDRHCLTPSCSCPTFRPSLPPQLDGGLLSLSACQCGHHVEDHRWPITTSHQEA
ncbi:MAG TPA: hypothetical protein VNF91_11230 [Candidatus Acidoferrum sp.]|nr:hypothetical protein [Candidatus Acidoferrum sp.]